MHRLSFSFYESMQNVTEMNLVLFVFRLALPCLQIIWYCILTLNLFVLAQRVEERQLQAVGRVCENISFS